MKRVAIVSVLLLAGCSGGGGEANGGSNAPPAVVVPTPTPTPTTTPTPDPTSSPTPDPTPTPAGPPVYSKFSDIYITRSGPGVVLPSACGSLSLSAEPPVALAVSAYGQGVTVRHVQTPQVWSVAGDGWSLGFDGRFADVLAPGEEIAHIQMVGTDTERFSVARPVISGAGIEYTRLVSVSKIVSGIRRFYRCVIGFPTLVSDLPAGAISYPGTVATGLAYVRDGATSRAYTLDRSTVTISADMAARRIVISLVLRATPADGVGADITLGTLAASAPIDPATGNFVASLTSSDRTVSGAVSGRLFGPQGIELAAALDAAVNAVGTQPAYSFTGAIFGAR